MNETEEWQPLPALQFMAPPCDGETVWLLFNLVKVAHGSGPGGCGAGGFGDGSPSGGCGSGKGSPIGVGSPLGAGMSAGLIASSYWLGSSVGSAPCSMRRACEKERSRPFPSRNVRPQQQAERLPWPFVL